jgi:hypothetical protein
MQAATSLLRTSLGKPYMYIHLTTLLIGACVTISTDTSLLNAANDDPDVDFRMGLEPHIVPCRLGLLDIFLIV